METSKEKYDKLNNNYCCLTNVVNNFLGNLPRSKKALELNYRGKPHFKDGKVDCFSYIPYEGITCTINAIRFVRSKIRGPTPTFCDAGAGYGFILQLAYNIGFKSYGIELDEFLHSCLIKQLYGNDERAIKGNILKQNYSKYKVVYYYSPISADKEERLFEELVEDTIKVGAFIIALRKQSERVLNDKRFKRLDNEQFGSTIQIYQKIKQ